MEKYYVISFGNSKKYKVPADDSKTIECAKEDIAKYLTEKFPSVDYLSFYKHITINEEPGSEADQYEDLECAKIEDIEKVLGVEVKDMESLDLLNRNAPFDDIS